LFLIFTAGFHVLTLLQVNATFFLFGLGQFLLGFLLIVVSIFSIVKIVKNKQRVPLLKRLQPLLFGLCLIASIPLVSHLVDTDGGKRTIINASSGGDLTFVELDLRDDGSFRLLNSGPFGGKFYRGHYKIKNDTLRIDNGDRNLYPTLMFVIKYDTTRRKKYFDPIPADTTKEPIYELYIQKHTNSP
jgi:hypothetical protein